MSKPLTPQLLARAVAVAMEPQAKKCWEYLDAWSKLEWAHVPVDDIRLYLDATEPRETQAMDEVASYAKRAQGMLVMHGPKGCGKTFAAVHFAHLRGLEGRSTVWLSASAWVAYDARKRKAMLARAHTARALVVDDLGSGSSKPSDWFAEDLTGILQDRGHRPTIVSCNGKRAEVEAWLGDRLMDRLEVAGGIVSIPLDASSLRQRSLDDLDDYGHGRRWKAARHLVDLIGVEERERTEQPASLIHDGWGHDDLGAPVAYSAPAKVTRWLEVGGALERAARVRGLAPVEAVARWGRLDWADVERKAKQIRSDDDKRPNWAQAYADKIKASARADNERRAKVCYGDSKARPPTRAAEVVVGPSESAEGPAS
jgi:DNA replication protein DnaC